MGTIFPSPQDRRGYHRTNNSLYKRTVVTETLTKASGQQEDPWTKGSESRKEAVMATTSSSLQEDY